MEELKHYGIAEKSGRYPWGSGENPYQSNRNFLAYISRLKDEGMGQTEIARSIEMTSGELRDKIAISTAEVRAADRATALKLKDKGYSNVAIGVKMNRNESSIRGLLDPAMHERSQKVFATANMLQENVDKMRYLDIGVGVERHMGITRTNLNTAIFALKEKGYKVQYSKVEQLGNPGQFTSLKVLTPPDVDGKELYANRHKIKAITVYSEDGGRSYLGLEPVKSVDSNRVKIVYSEDGGKEKDGLLEIRRGTEDLSLGQARYAQVRVGVDDKYYMKGMAVYSDDLPDGVDILYNTTKPRGTDPSKVFKSQEPDMSSKEVIKIRESLISEGLTGKELSSEVSKRAKAGIKDGSVPTDQDNPFGSIVRQKHYIDKNGKEQLSALNIMGYAEGSGEEGHWGEWSKSLSSQFLSKQSPALATRQLGRAYDSKQEEFDEIISLTNNAVKRRLLQPFADNCDSAAVHLKAAALPRQSTHVILPVPNMKENEVYAPNYNNGERVVLVRHPHGGIFEIPELVVNNKHPGAKKMLGQAKDGIGIHPKTAEVLSGADFDGDTVLVIPNSARTGIKISAPLAGLKDFDPQITYKGYEGMSRMKASSKGSYMGDISNLITDMTIKGANESELASAVRHSMVVIDAEKHGLNFKQSYKDNNIAFLKTKYQGGANRGANTLISKASSREDVLQKKQITNANKMTPAELKLHKEGHKIFRETGESYEKRIKTSAKVFKETGERYTGETKTIMSTTKSKKMTEAKDAFDLSSGTQMEGIYATHANKLKALANQARKELLGTPPTISNPSAKKVYAPEVARLDAALNVALKNAPVERQALILSNQIVAIKQASNPGMDKSDLKKLRTQSLNEARNRVGAKRIPIEISDREWEAIQAGAVSNTKLNQILNNTDIDRIKTLATPRTNPTMTPAMASRAEAMLGRGATQAEVASALGVSVSTISKIM